jgi:hypothetical protein
MLGIERLAAIAGIVGRPRFGIELCLIWKARILAWFWAIGGGTLWWHALNHGMHHLFERLRNNNKMTWLALSSPEIPSLSGQPDPQVVVAGK